MERFENFFDAFDKEHSGLELFFEIQYPWNKLSAHVTTYDRRISRIYGYRTREPDYGYDLDIPPNKDDEDSD